MCVFLCACVCVVGGGGVRDLGLLRCYSNSVFGCAIMYDVE